MQCYPRWPRPPRGPKQISAQGSFPPNLRACLCQTVTADRSELRLQSSRCFLSVRAIGHNKQDGGYAHRFHFEPMKRLLQIARMKIVWPKATVAMGCITASCCSNLQNKMHRWIKTEGGVFIIWPTPALAIVCWGFLIKCLISLRPVQQKTLVAKFIFKRQALLKLPLFFLFIYLF